MCYWIWWLSYRFPTHVNYCPMLNCVLIHTRTSSNYNTGAWKRYNSQCYNTLSNQSSVGNQYSSWTVPEWSQLSVTSMHRNKWSMSAVNSMQAREWSLLKKSPVHTFQLTKQLPLDAIVGSICSLYGIPCMEWLWSFWKGASLEKQWW